MNRYWHRHEAPYAVGLKVCSFTWVGGKKRVTHECALHPDHVDGGVAHECTCESTCDVDGTQHE